MCTDGTVSDGTADGGLPAGEAMSVAVALRMMDAALDYLNGPGVRDIEAAGLGGVLESLAGLGGRFAAARAAILARFDAERGHAADGYGSTASWLAAKGRTTRRAANAEVRRMRQFSAHPVIAAAVAAGELSDSWAAEIADWTRRLPLDW